MKDCICGGRNTNCSLCYGRGYHIAGELRTPRPLRKMSLPNPVVVPTVSPSERAARQQKLLKELLALEKHLALKKELALALERRLALKMQLAAFKRHPAFKRQVNRAKDLLANRPLSK